MPKKAPSSSINQTAIGNENIQVVGSNNIINRITKIFQVDTEQQRAPRNRLNMLELVENTWIKGVLEKSLYSQILIDLGMEDRIEEVDHPWGMLLQTADQTNRTLPSNTLMSQIFDESNGALLIL